MKTTASVSSSLAPSHLKRNLAGIFAALLFSFSLARADVSSPRISQFQPASNGSVLLSWDAVPESAYRVLVSSNLNDGSWEPIDYIVASGNTVTWQANGQPAGSRFYLLATDGISIRDVEPSTVSTGVVLPLYISGQGFGSNDVLRLLGPGGPLTLTNRIIIKPTLISVVVGPGFTPDVPGTYELELTSGSTGRKATFTWTVDSSPPDVLEPPRDPPASPSAREVHGHVTLIKFDDDGEQSNARQKELTGHVTLIKFTDEEAASNRQKELTGHVTLIKFDEGSESSARQKELTGHVTLIKFNGDDESAERQLTGSNPLANSPLNPGAALWSTDCDDNDPAIHPWSGETCLQSVDLAIPGRGLDFIWARTYRARATPHSGMTYRWTCSYDVSVEQKAGGIAVYDGTGRGDLYSPDTNGVYSRNAFFNEGTVTQNAFTLTFPDSGRWVFNPFDGSASAGKLAAIVDRNHNTMTFGYDVAGRLTKIIDDLGRTNTVAYNALGLLSGITDFSGRTVTYQYYAGEAGGSSGDLKSVTSPSVTGTPDGNDFPAGKTISYTYSSGFSNDNENHLLLSTVDGKGQTLRQFTYQHNTSDFAFLRCLTAQSGTNLPAYFTYLPQTATPSNGFATVKVIARDPAGNVGEASYDSRNRLVDLRQFTGRAPKPGAVTDVSNRPVGKLRPTDPDFYETRWSWNQDSLCVAEFEPSGNSFSFVYQSDFDKNASPRKRGDLRVCRQLPCCADLDRDGFPDIVSRYQYDPRFGSPARNYCVQYRESDFDFASVGIDSTTTVAYRAINTKGTGAVVRLLPTVNKRTSKRGNDAAGAMRLLPTVNKRTRNDGAGTSGGKLTTGQPAIVDNKKGLSVRFCVSQTDPRGNITVGSYDPQGNLLRVTWTIDLTPPTVSISYNSYGQVIGITNAADANGRQRVDSATYYTNGPQAGYLRDFTIDLSGPTFTRTSFEYDAHGNVTRCIDPRTNDWLYTYNALDQLVQSSSPSLTGSGSTYRISTFYAYDAADNLTGIDLENRDYTGAPGTNTTWHTQFVYDQQNRLSGCWRDKDGHLVLRCTEVKYDSNDNLALYRSGEAVNGHDTNKVVQFTFDERDRLFQCTAAPGSPAAATIQCDYDLNGWPASKKYVDAFTPSIITYTYDGFSRKSSRTDPMGNIVTNRYDANGNLILIARLGETNDVPGSAGNVLLEQCVCQYDGLDRCVSVRRSHFNPGGAPVGDGIAVTALAYAPNGQCASVTDDNGHVTRFTYDTLCRLASVIDAKTNTVAYGYDNNENLITLTRTDKSDLGGADQVFVTTMTHDPLNRCTSAGDNTGNTRQYAYDSRNNLARQVDAKGQLTGYSYDGLNRPTVVACDLDGDGFLDIAADAAFTYSYDDNDCLVVATDDNTNSTVYAYDSLNRLVMKTCADGTFSSFVWDSRSQLVLSTDPNGTTVSNRYDLLQRCVRRDVFTGAQVSPLTTFETFAYDGCSRLTQASNDVSRLDYAYDSLGNCAMFKQDCVASTCTYDGVGNCLSITYPGGRTVSYAYDAINQMTGLSTGSGGLPPSTLATYGYEGPGRPGRILRANNINTRIVWDGLVSPANSSGDFGWQQVSRMNHAMAGGNPVIDQRLFAYDRNQNKTLRAQTAPFVQGQKSGTNLWSFSPLDQLTHSIYTKSSGVVALTDYSLDAQGNRRGVTNNGIADLYSRDPASPPADFQVDQYTSTPLGSELHDANGNLMRVTSAAAELAYVYDYADRLSGVYDISTGTPSPVATFTYDATGRRLTRTTYPPSPLAPVTRYYVLGMVHRSVKDDDRDGSVPVLEMRSGGPAGPVTHSYCWGMDRFGRPAVNTALASFNGAGALEYYFLCDDLGTELALTDGFGNVLERYDYDDYGAPHFLTSDGIATSATNSAFENPFLFHGMQWDAETGFYCKMSGENPLYESPRDGRYVLRAGMPLRPGANAYSFDNDNPWSACSKTKTQGDFNLAHRFSVEIDGVLVAGVSEPPTITDCDDNDPKRHHPTSIARPLRLGFGILVVSGSNDRVTSSPYRTRELTGHVTLIK